MRPSQVLPALLACAFAALPGCGVDPADVAASVRQGLVAYESGKKAEAKTAWSRAANAGSVEAQYYLGVLSNEGDDANPAEAAAWFQKAAERGHAKAQYNLALAYERGIGVLRNRGSAINWLKKAAAQGEPDAQHMLGLLLIDEGSMAEAVGWFTKAADAGHVPAQFALGSAYLNGDIVAKQPALADRWLSAALRAGEVRALRPLLSAREQLATVDDVPTEVLQRKAQSGDSVAQHRLAVRLLSGKDAAAQADDAERWLRASAEAGFPLAQYDLGLLLSERAPEQGLQWVRRAAGKGLAKAQYALGRAYAQGIAVERDEAQAYRWYSSAAEQDMPSAEYAVGYALSHGAGVRQDAAEAMSWYKRGALHGHAESAFQVSTMYANGDGVSKSPTETRRWECRALVLGNEDAGRNIARRGGIDIACVDYRDDLAGFVTDVLGTKPDRSSGTAGE